MKSLTFRVKKQHIYLSLLVLTYFLRAITDALFVAQNISSAWTLAKYISLLLAFLYGTIIVVQGKKIWKCVYILKYIGIVTLFFFFVSLLKMIYVGTFSVAIFRQMFVMLFPAFIAVITMSIANLEDIYKFFCCILVVTFPVYCVLEIGLDIFTKDNFELISFAASFSPFESHYSAGTAMVLCAFFSYFRKSKIWMYLSLGFVFLTFKRLSVVCAIILVVLPAIINVSTKVSRKIPMICGIGFCALTIIYFWLLIPSNQEVLMKILNVDSVTKFTMMRSEFFETIYSSPFFVNFGWGSCEAHLGKLLEMELIQILIETSVVGLLVFSLCYWKIAGTTIYAILYMGFEFANLLTSHDLGNGFAWCLVLIMLASVNLEANNRKVKVYKIRIKDVG